MSQIVEVLLAKETCDCVRRFVVEFTVFVESLGDNHAYFARIPAPMQS